MKALKETLKDKNVNDLTTAVILGTSIFSFANYFGTSLSRAFFEPGYSWSWDRFFTQIIILIFGIAAGVGVHYKLKR